MRSRALDRQGFSDDEDAQKDAFAAKLAKDAVVGVDGVAPGDIDVLVEATDGAEETGEGHDDDAFGFTTSTSDDEQTGRRVSSAWGDTGMNATTAFEAEREVIHQKFEFRNGRHGASSSTVRFGVAFSGGGVRAAAFQAGVLWRLAQADKLRDVEHLVAVSGGAYLASAFSSQLVAAGQPRDGEDLNKWYRTIVARTLCRMQRNIGYFVRDWRLGALRVRDDGSGRWPPITDIPVLIVVILFTIISNPLTHVIVYLVPLAECLNFFMGMSMRAAYCGPTHAKTWWIFESWSPLHMWAWNLAWLVLLTFAAWLVGMLLPPCRKPKRRPLHDEDCAKHKVWSAHLCFLYLQSFRAAMTRILVVLAIVIIVLGLSMSSELYDDMPLIHLNQTRFEFCQAFILNDGRLKADDDVQKPRCGDMRLDASGHWLPWWRDPMFDCYRNGTCAEEETPAEIVFVRPQASPSVTVNEAERSSFVFQFLALPFRLRQHFGGSSLFVSLVFLLLAMLAVALVLTPIFKGLFIFCVSLVGPTAALFFAASFIQYRIFGPLTGQFYARMFDLWPFNAENYMDFHIGCLVLAFIMMVFFHPIHFASHYFYTRSLRLAYFEKGQDITWNQLLMNPYCPFMIFTGTVTDWKRPGDKEGISEISISPLHTGSAKTGFVTTPPWRSVAKCTAIAAAATDAFILGMFDRIRYRFWLEFLNLRMGDYILFERFRNPCVAWCQKRRLPCLARRESFVFYEFPLVALGGSAYIVWIIAGFVSQSGEEAECDSAHSLYVLSTYMVITIIFLSFFAFVPCLEFFVHSPMMRQIHMAMRYYHVSESPPSMMFVSDGGVQDCTGVLQLMRRRCGRILLALAAADPDDDLNVLRETMRMAVRLKIGSFYDPSNPKRDVSMVLDDFKKDRSKTFLRLAIYYGWDAEPDSQTDSEDSAAEVESAPIHPTDQRRTCDLFIVKNRLPPECEGLLVEPLLEEFEIDPPAQRAAAGSDMSSCSSAATRMRRLNSTDIAQRELAGCCCDFCHVLGCNLGPKFPHITNANQCLTPALFSSLCRLGYRLSADAVNALSTESDEAFDGRV